MRDWQETMATVILSMAMTVMGYLMMPPLQEVAGNMNRLIGSGLVILAGIGLTVFSSIVAYRSFWRERVQLLGEYLWRAQRMKLSEAIEALRAAGICFNNRPAFSRRAERLFWHQDVEVIGDTLGTLMTSALEGPEPKSRNSVMWGTAEILVDQYIEGYGKCSQNREERPEQLKELLDIISIRHPAYKPELSEAIIDICRRLEEQKEKAKQEEIDKRVRRITK